MIHADIRQADAAPTRKFLGRTLVFILTINLIVCLVLLFRPALFFVFGLVSHGLNPQIVNLDFSNYWFAGKLITAGSPVAVLYHEIYFPAAQAFFGVEYNWHSWSYPPHFMLLVWPLSFLPYKMALLTFLGSTLALFVFACRKIAGTGLANERLFWIMLLPVIITNTVAAQNGFLTSGLMLLAFAVRAEGRYLFAGFLLACLTIKPQLGALIPLYLFIQRDWRTLVSASVFSVALIGISSLAFGADAWTAYLEVTVPYMSHVMNTGTGIFVYMMPTFFMAARSLGLNADTAVWVQAVVAIPLLLLFVYAILKTGNELTRLYLLAAFTFLLVPYGFNYDLGALIALGCLVYLRQSQAISESTPEHHSVHYADIAIWLLALLPVVTTRLALAGLPLGPVIILATTLYFLTANRAGALPEQHTQLASG